MKVLAAFKNRELVGAPALRWSRSATLNKQKSSQTQLNLKTCFDLEVMQVLNIFSFKDILI